MYEFYKIYYDFSIMIFYYIFYFQLFILYRLGYLEMFL